MNAIDEVIARLAASRNPAIKAITGRARVAVTNGASALPFLSEIEALDAAYEKAYSALVELAAVMP